MDFQLGGGGGGGMLEPMGYYGIMEVLLILLGRLLPLQKVLLSTVLRTIF